MPRFEITAPDGARYEINAPEGATEDDAIRFLQGQMQKGEAQQGPAPSWLESAGRGALQGATFGFGDEIYGAAKGAYDALAGGGDFTGTYERERDAVRAANAAAQKANPGTYLAGELVGGVAVPVGGAAAGLRTAAAAGSRSLGARALASAKTGAGYGAAYGLGTAQGSPVDQAINTASGAVAGGAVGAALPPLIAVGSSMAQMPGRAVRSFSNPERVAAEKVAEAFSRDAGSEVVKGASPVVNAARRAISERMTGDPVILADFGGENVKNLVRAAVNMPNARAERFNQVLNRRQATQGRRLQDVLTKTLADGNEFTATLDDLVKARAADATPAFNTAYARPFQIGSNSELPEFLGRGYMQRLVKKTADSIEGMTGQNPADMAPWEFLHRVKMEINREIGRMKRGQGDSAANWTLSDLTKLNQEYGRILRAENPDLGKALSRYADESTMINALEDGLDDFFKLSPEDLAAKVRRMSKQEAELYRIGATRAQVEKLRSGDVMRDRTKSLYGSDDIGQRLKAVFPEGSPARGQFLRAINNARRMASTRRAAQGNSTTAKQLTQAQEAGKAVKTAADVAGAVTGKAGAVLNMLERGANFASGLTPRVAAEVLNMSMAGPTAGSRAQAALRTIDALRAATQRQSARQVRQNALLDALLPAAGQTGTANRPASR